MATELGVSSPWARSLPGPKGETLSRAEGAALKELARHCRPTGNPQKGKVPGERPEGNRMVEKQGKAREETKEPGAGSGEVQVLMEELNRGPGLRVGTYGHPWEPSPDHDRQQQPGGRRSVRRIHPPS